jgi:hypothetical protein
MGRYTDDVEQEEYGDISMGPRNMGRIRPNQAEWGDYIQSAQEDTYTDYLLVKSHYQK